VTRKKKLTRRKRTDGNRDAGRVLARVAAGGEDDGDGVALSVGELDRVEPSLDARLKTGKAQRTEWVGPSGKRRRKCEGKRAHKHDLGQVGLLVEEEHESLSLGVSESDVVLEDLGTLGGEHEAGEEKSDERVAWIRSSKGRARRQSESRGRGLVERSVTGSAD
jgi:hypothetical protein